MAKLALATRATSTFFRILELLIAILVLGIFSWYLAYLSKHHLEIPRWQKAVEGMSGAAVIYTAFGVILTCFLGGIAFFAFLAIVLDVCFAVVFGAIAVLTRAGQHSCGSVNDSPIGIGHRQSCQLQRAVFVVSIVAVFLFVVTAALQIALARHHTKEKRFGPSPANNYTSGSGNRKFWARKNRKNKQAELNTLNASGATAARNEDTTKINGNGNVDVENGYGGTSNRYASTNAQPTLPANTTGYTPRGTGYQATGYVPQESGVIGGGPGTSAPAEMPAKAPAHGTGGYVH